MTTFKRNFIFNKNDMIVASNSIRKYRKEAKIIQDQLAINIKKPYNFIKN